MTKKDFELIARVIRGELDDRDTRDKTVHAATLRDLAISFNRELVKTNDRFDQQRFLNACGF